MVIWNKIIDILALGVGWVKPQSHDDDIDDIMASIMGASTPKLPPKQTSTPPVHRNSPLAPSSTQTQQRAQAKHPENPVAPRPVAKKQPRSATRSKSRRKALIPSFKSILLLSGSVVFIFGGILLWNGIISPLLAPKSPFASDLQEKMDIPLYFPTKLPDGFKIETNSINQPENNIVIYTVSDDTNKRITISLQRQPKNINLDPLYENLSALKETDTKFGKVKVGISEDNVYMANVLTGETWVIITSQDNILDIETLQTIVDNLQV